MRVRVICCDLTDPQEAKVTHRWTNPLQEYVLAKEGEKPLSLKTSGSPQLVG